MNEIIIRKIFEKLDKNVNKIVSASNSYNSNVYIIESDNDKYVFKISNNKQKRENECKYYNYLSKIIPTAKVLDSGEINDIQYNIITFLEGVNLFDEECNSLNKNQIYNIGKLLAKVHTADLIDDDNDSWILYLNNVLEKTNDTLEKIFAPRPVGVAISVPFSTLSPALTIAAQGAPTCWRNKICTFPMTPFLLF